MSENRYAGLYNFGELCSQEKPKGNRGKHEHGNKVLAGPDGGIIDTLCLLAQPNEEQ